MRKHQMTHSKSYICDICKKPCRDKATITRHIFTKHIKSEPKYKCEICQKKFQLEILLKAHTINSHREKKLGNICEVFIDIY